MTASCAASVYASAPRGRRRSSSWDVSTDRSTPRDANSSASSRSTKALTFDAKPTDKFGDVCTRFFKEIKAQRSVEEVERCIRRDLIPQWGNKPIGSITKQDVRSVVNAIK